jgi:hypothetical protein
MVTYRVLFRNDEIILRNIAFYLACFPLSIFELSPICFQLSIFCELFLDMYIHIATFSQLFSFVYLPQLYCVAYFLMYL